MNSTYRELERIWRRVFEDGVTTLEAVIPLLDSHGISFRKKDGELQQINLSIPTSKYCAFVVGLRYRKKDGTCTEDHFLCQRDHFPEFGRQKIEYHPKRRLEDELPEYKGTHKQQVDFRRASNNQDTERFRISRIDASTISYTRAINKNESNSGPLGVEKSSDGRHEAGRGGCLPRKVGGEEDSTIVLVFDRG